MTQPANLTEEMKQKLRKAIKLAEDISAALRDQTNEIATMERLAAQAFPGGIYQNDALTAAKDRLTESATRMTEVAADLSETLTGTRP